MIRTGFIGLGTQGKPIAAHLAPAGFETTVYDILDAPVKELVRGGAEAAGSPRELGTRADIIGICVPEDQHLQAVMRGENGLLAGAAEGTLVLVHSTVQPETVVTLADEASAKGIRVVDACVSGGVRGASSKQLTYMVGARAEELEDAQPYFAATTEKEVLYAEGIGNGCRLKLALNIITFIEWAAAFESVQLAFASGLPVELLEKAGLSNGQLTPMMLEFVQILKWSAEQVRSEESQTFLRENMFLAEKDLTLALALGRKSQISMPVAGLVAQQMARIYQVEDEGRR